MTASSPILVADDDRDFGEVVKDFLGRAGFEVHYTSSGFDAIERFSSLKPPVAIIDGSLPGVDGLSICGAIKDLAPETYVLLVSAADRRPDVKQLPAGQRPDAFLLKPFPLSSLMEAIAWRPRHFSDESRTSVEPPVIEGDLHGTSFWDLYARLLAERSSGVLSIDLKPQTLEIFFINGIPVFAQGGDIATTLGRLLVRDRLLTEEQYAQALVALHADMQAGRSTRLGEVLARLSLLTPIEIAQALARQVEEKVILAFSLRHGAFRLANDSSFKSRVTCFNPSPEKLLLRGLRHAASDGDLVAILKRAGSSVAALAPDAHDRLVAFGIETRLYRALKLVDGTRTLREAVMASPIDRRETALLLAALVLAGVIHMGPADASMPRPAPAPMPVAPAAPPPPPAERVTPAPAPESPHADLANRIVLEYLTFGGKSPRALLGIPAKASADAVRQASKVRLAELAPENLPESFTGDLRNMAAVLHSAISRASQEALTPARPAGPTPARRRIEEQAVQAELRFREGETLVASKDYTGAFEAFRAAAELNPGTAEYLTALGWAAFRRSPGSDIARREACDYIDKSLAIDPKQSMAYYYLSRIARVEGDTVKADAFGKKALAAAAREDGEGADDAKDPKTAARGWTERLKFWH